MDLRVFIFTWNTQTVRYDKADFVDVLAQRINNTNQKYDLVVVALQEDAIRESLLLANDSSIIANSLHEYQLIKLVSLSGWGVTTYKALKDDWDYQPRGLRLAVFKRCDLDLDISSIESKELVCPGVRDWITAGKGGVVVNLNTSAGKISFLNVHLPFSSRSLMRDDPANCRHDAVMWQINCLHSLYDNATSEFNPDHLFIMGDLNFRVQIRAESGAKEIAQNLFDNPDYIKELISEADELRLLLDYSQHAETQLSEFCEGVDNNGPVFLPTCKLAHGRETVEYKYGKKNQRTPSWCDRILYSGKVTCILYDRWEYGTMNLSDHAAVIGEYCITRHNE